MAVKDIQAEKKRLMTKLSVADFKIHSKSEVPVKWLLSPIIALFEYLNKARETQIIKGCYRRQS